MIFKKFGLKAKPRMRMLLQLVGELSLRGRLVLSYPRAKNVKSLFLKMQKLESRGHYDKIRSLLRITKAALSKIEVTPPFLEGKKVYSRAFGFRINNSTRLMELRTDPILKNIPRW